MFIPATPNEDLSQLRELVADFLARKFPTVDSGPPPENGHTYDRALWAAFGGELGLAGLGIDEELGGSGGGIEEIAVVLEELGRALAPTPYFGTVGLASSLLLQLPPSAERDDLLRRIASGDTTATVAYCGGEGAWDLSDIPADASNNAGSWQISGRRSFVIDGPTADVILVPARTGAGLSVFSVPGIDPSVSRTELKTLDLTRPQAHIEFDSTPAQILGPEGAAEMPLEQALRLAILAQSAEQVGAAEYILSSTLEYAKYRYQFGRSIGSFQAIKHKLADVVFDLERMKSAETRLIELAASHSPDFPMMTHLGKAFCSEAFFRIAAESVQIFGGIGFTWEHSAHLYFRRAKSTELLLGSPTYHRSAMLSRLGA